MSKMNRKRATSRYVIIKLSKVKDKEGILKTAREKTNGYIQRKPHETVSRFCSRNFAGHKRMA